MSTFNNNTVFTSKSFAFTLATNGGALDGDLAVRNANGNAVFRALNEGAGFGASRGLLNAVMDLSLGMYQEIHGNWMFLKQTIAWLEGQPALKSISGHAMGCDAFREWAALNTAYTMPIIRGHVYDLQWTGVNFQVFHIEKPAQYVEGEENHDAKKQARNTIHKTNGLHAIMKALMGGYNFRILATKDLQDAVLMTNKYQAFIAAHNLGDEAQLTEIRKARKDFARDLGAKNRAGYIASQNAGALTERTAKYLGETVPFMAVGATEVVELNYNDLVGKKFKLQHNRGSRYFYYQGTVFIGTNDNVLQLALIVKGEDLTAVEVEAGE